jgi:conserved oligomeric Golgi complex subunit 3
VPVKSITDLIVEPEVHGPPEATVARRAKSYSDFYDAVRAYTKKEKRAEKRRSQEWLKKEEPKEWDFSVGEELVDASHEEYELYHQQLQVMESHLDTILADTTSALNLLSELSSSFKAVEAQTSAFRGQCEGLLSETRRVDQLAEDIRDNVQYYTYLEPITKRLNAPGAGNFVRNQEFSQMLVTLDNCIEYMQAHVCLLCLTVVFDSIANYALGVTKRSCFIPITISTSSYTCSHVDPCSFHQ